MVKVRRDSYLVRDFGIQLRRAAIFGLFVVGTLTYSQIQNQGCDGCSWRLDESTYQRPTDEIIITEENIPLREFYIQRDETAIQDPVNTIERVIYQGN